MNKLSTINQTQSRRRGFTLVELLLVIAIIAILASLGVGVMAQAQEDAAIAATRSRMSMIQKILEIELEDYEVRRSPVSFLNIGSLMRFSSLTNPAGERTLIHAKNLKRMIIADLIRAEMPDGSLSGATLGQFPSETMREYLRAIGISNPNIDAAFPTVAPPSVSGWSTWTVPTDSVAGDGIDEGAANKSELLYQILLNIDVDGVPAVDQLGGQAIGDSDGDTVPEIVDAWGEPLYLQWQQENVTLAAGGINENFWNDGTNMIGQSKEHADISVGYPTVAEYSKPVLPSQIRPFLMSERMLKIDGLPSDYDTNHAF